MHIAFGRPHALILSACVRFQCERTDAPEVRASRRLPSIAVTLSVIGVVLLAPFLGVTSAHWRSSSSQVESAQRVTASAERLAVLLRLGPAVSNEILATSWDSGQADLISELPNTATPILNLNVANTVEATQSPVDWLAKELDDPTLIELIEQSRAANTQNATDVTAVIVNFDPVVAWLQSTLENELVILTAAASATGDESLARSVRLAEAAADVQTSMVGMDGRWAQLYASKFLPPVSMDVQLFNHRLIEFQDQSSVFEATLAPTGETRDRWDEFRGGSELQAVLTEYTATANQVAYSGIPAMTSTPPTLDLSEIDFAEALAVAAKISDTFASADEADAQLDAVVDAAIIELRIDAQTSVERANAERSRTVLWLTAAAVLFLFATIAIAALIGQPVRRMAEAAEKLSEGKLDVRVPENGPREIRVGSTALNQALTSLKTTEAQALALAEERLDDTVLRQNTPGDLGRSLQAAVQKLAASLADRELIQQQLEYEATHDGLTKLANRRAVLAHLDGAIARADRSTTHAAVFFVDLDDFKSVNDSHGHYLGDNVLQTIAERLLTTVRAGDLAGRLGGDEFVVVAEPVFDVEEAIQIGDRIRRAINKPIVVDGTTITPDASIGVGLSSGDLNADEILRDADLAVYRAKGAGKSRVHVCDEELRDEVRDRAALEAAIVEAIEEDEFTMYYQPTVGAANHNVLSVEALIRWHRPTRGVVSPADFIPVAERTDLIIDLDCWVLGAVGRQLANWSRQPETATLQVAVNISARHLSSGKLAAHVKSVLGQFGFDPNYLILEVTETALLNDVETAAADLAELRSLGVRIALDDFGTGFMSLSHLRSLPVDVVKIDQSFISEIEDHETRSLIQLILDTGHLLEFSVTAEGVETYEQAVIMAELGADSLQGYFFSYPKPAHEVTAEIIDRSGSEPQVA